MKTLSVIMLVVLVGVSTFGAETKDASHTPDKTDKKAAASPKLSVDHKAKLDGFINACMAPSANPAVKR